MSERIYFECHCQSPEHTLHFWMDEDNPPLLNAYVFLNADPWWKRIWQGIKHVFGYKCRYGHFDEFIFNPKDCDRFIEMLQQYKRAYEKYNH